MGMGQRVRGSSLVLHAGGKKLSAVSVSLGRILEISGGLLEHHASHPNAPGTGVLGYWGVGIHVRMYAHTHFRIY